MTKRDKDGLLIVGTLLGLIILIAVVVCGTSVVNPVLLTLLLLVIQHVILMSKVCDMYYSVLNSEVGFIKYIPVVNELCIFPPTLAIATLIGWVCTILSAVLSFVPVTVIADIFSEHFAMNYTVRVMLLAIVCYFLTSLIRGAGLMSVLQNVIRMYKQAASNTHLPLLIPSVIASLFPLTKILTVGLIFERLHALTILRNYHYEEDIEKDKMKEE